MTTSVSIEKLFIGYRNAVIERTSHSSVTNPLARQAMMWHDTFDESKYWDDVKDVKTIQEDLESGYIYQKLFGLPISINKTNCTKWEAESVKVKKNKNRGTWVLCLFLGSLYLYITFCF